jgi:chromosome partitioning protein
MRKIALVNQKGGVGKTTTAVNLSAAIARLDRRVLLIDLDPQSNATISLGVPPHEQKNTSYALLNGAPLDPIKLSDNLHLVPSNIELAGAEMELTSVIGRESVLRDALAEVSGYDFMILDCSPSLGLLSVNSLTTANEVMVPLQCEFLALHGISLLLKTVELVKKRLNPKLEITGVIPCMYDVRKGLARDVVVEIEKHFGSKVFKTKIRSNVRLAEAPSHGKSIFDYAPDSNGAEDYMALGREVIGIEQIEKLAAAKPAAVERAASPYVPAAVYAHAPAFAEAVVARPAEPPAPAASEASSCSAVALAPAEVSVAVADRPAEVPARTALDEIVDAPLNPEPAPLPAPAVAADVPLIEPAPESPAHEPAPDSVVEVVPDPAHDLMSDGIVEFIELIPLEIEELPRMESSGA